MDRTVNNACRARYNDTGDETVIRQTDGENIAFSAC
jgi:hypothetical protein